MRLDDFKKGPTDRLDYDINLARWFPVGDSVSAATATITGSTAVADLVQFASQSVKVWISGGASGDLAEVDVTVTTSAGRVMTFTFRLQIAEC